MDFASIGLILKLTVPFDYDGCDIRMSRYPFTGEIIRMCEYLSHSLEALLSSLCQQNLYSVDRVDITLEMEQWAKQAAMARAACFFISGATSSLYTLYILFVLIFGHHIWKLPNMTTHGPILSS